MVFFPYITYPIMAYICDASCPFLFLVILNCHTGESITLTVACRITLVHYTVYSINVIRMCFVLLYMCYINLLSEHMRSIFYIIQGCLTDTVASSDCPSVCEFTLGHKFDQYQTTISHNKVRTVCIDLGMYCIYINVELKYFRWCNDIFYPSAQVWK